MFKKRFLLVALITVLAMAMLAGCGFGKKPANEVLQNALVKASEVKSAAIDGQIDLKLDLSSELLEIVGPEEQMILDVLKNMKISYKGNYQLEPSFQAEVTLSATVPFEGMQMTFDLPILMTSDKMWMKFPNLPVPGTEDFAGKFIEIDFTQLAALSGQPMPNINESIQATNKFTNEITPIFFKNFDESYFSNVDVKTLTLANGSTAKNAVEFKITQENLKPFFITVVEKVLPEVFDVMAKPEYQSLFGLTPEMVTLAKQELTISPGEIDEAFADLEQVIKNLVISTVYAIDKDGFMPQTKISVSGMIVNPNEPGSVTFALTIVNNQSKINETATFENAFPPANTIPFEELMFMGMGMLDDSFYGDYDFDYDYDYTYDEEYGSDAEFSDDELMALYDELFLQQWFIDNEDIINELYNTNDEFAMDMDDPDVIYSLIYDPEYRDQFFAYYGVELQY